MRLAAACSLLAACYPGVDNSDCEIRCGEANACPSNLECRSGFCVDDGQTCQDPGLVLAYSFEQTADDQVPDDSGFGNTAGFDDKPMLVDGVYGSGLAFDGVDDGLIVRHSPSLAVAAGGALTVSFWIDVTEQEFLRDQIIIAKVFMNDVTTTPFYEWGVEFDMDDKVLELFLSSDQGAFIVACQLTIPIGAFTHAAFTWDGEEVIGYVDGAPQSCEPAQSVAITIPDYGQNLVIGHQSTPQEFFTGSLDDVRLYNRALTASEIVADKNSPL